MIGAKHPVPKTKSGPIVPVMDIDGVMHPVISWSNKYVFQETDIEISIGMFPELHKYPDGISYTCFQWSKLEYKHGDNGLWYIIYK